MLNKVFKINFIKLLMYNYIKLKVQINCICFLKEFKVSKILCITTFDIICTWHKMCTPYHGNTLNYGGMNSYI
jgi:hypothetical protein